MLVVLLRVQADLLNDMLLNGDHCFRGRHRLAHFASLLSAKVGTAPDTLRGHEYQDEQQHYRPQRRHKYLFEVVGPMDALHTRGEGEHVEELKPLEAIEKRDDWDGESQPVRLSESREHLHEADGDLEHRAALLKEVSQGGNVFDQ